MQSILYILKLLSVIYHINRLTTKHSVISMWAVKAVDKV